MSDEHESTRNDVLRINETIFDDLLTFPLSEAESDLKDCLKELSKLESYPAEIVRDLKAVLKKFRSVTSDIENILKAHNDFLESDPEFQAEKAKLESASDV